MTDDIIRYDVLLQESLRSVVRKVLIEVAKVGLPGEHHFFISFDTRGPGVRLSERLRIKYPDEMTIIVQHQYWNLMVSEREFSLDLSFGGQMESLIIPFSSIRGFFDPSVQFGLQFEPEEQQAPEHKLVGEQYFPKQIRNNKPQYDLPPVGDDLVVTNSQTSNIKDAQPDPGDKRPSQSGLKNGQTLNAGKSSTKNNSPKPSDHQNNGAEVLYIDTFRKK